MSDEPHDAPTDRQSFARLLASPEIFGAAFLPAERAEWRGDRFTLGRARRRTPKDLFVGVRLQPADRRNIDVSRERAVQHDLAALVRSLVAIRAKPGLAGAALSREVALGRDPAGVRRARFGLTQPADGGFHDEGSAAAASHAAIVRAIRRSGLAIASAPPFEPADGFAGLQAWASAVRLRPSRLYAAMTYGKIAAAVGAVCLVLSMIPSVARGIRNSFAAAHEYLFPTLAEPSGIEASDGVDGRFCDGVHVRWRPVDKATGYAIYRSVDGCDDQDAMRVPIATVAGGDADEFRDAEAEVGRRACYRVRATTMFSHGPHSAPDEGCRGISAPTAVRASEGTSTEAVELSWEPVDGAEEYEVRREGQLVCTCPGAESACRDTNAPPGKKCCYTVCATKGKATSQPSAATGCRGLNAPVGVAASDGTDSTCVAVKWDQVPGAESYRVTRRCSDGTCEPKSFPPTRSASLRDDSAEPGRTYAYSVAAEASGMTSEAGEADEGWRGYEPAVAKASDGEFIDRVRVTWNPVPGATGYQVYRDDSGEPLGATDGDGKTEYVDRAASEDTRHRYAVRPVTPRTDVPKGPPDDGWRALAPPGGVNASRDQTDRVDIAWKATEGARGFQVSRDKQVIHTSKDASVTSFQDRTAEIGRKYEYAVASVGANTGAGPPCEPRSGYRWLEKPGNVVAKQAGKGVQVSWEGVEGATRYEVLRSDKKAPQGIDLQSSPWLDDQPAPAAVTYRVRGRTDDVTGPESEPTPPIAVDAEGPAAETVEGTDRSP